jgi:uncharacterized membrane protein
VVQFRGTNPIFRTRRENHACQPHRRAVFHADVTFHELVRTLGLAYVWNVIGVFGFLAAISEALSCVLAPVMIIAVIAMIVAWFIAAKEAQDLEWLQTIVTVFLGWLALVVITLVLSARFQGQRPRESPGQPQAQHTFLWYNETVSMHWSGEKLCGESANQVRCIHG